MARSNARCSFAPGLVVRSQSSLHTAEYPKTLIPIFQAKGLKFARLGRAFPMNASQGISWLILAELGTSVTLTGFVFAELPHP